MSHQGRIFDFISQFPGRDDDEIAHALKIKPRQTVNKACRELVSQDVIQRRPNERGKIGNYPLVEQTLPLSGKVKVDVSTSHSDRPADWFWEGNVVDSLVAHFIREGWTIVRCADTASREHGPDIEAERDGEVLLVEAKGYPSSQYRDPARAGEKKPTNPSLQAQHWFSHALLKGVRLQSGYPHAIVVLAFPDFPRYRALVGEISGSLKKLGLRIAFVDESGSVHAPFS